MRHLIFGVLISTLVIGCRTNVILIDGIPAERTQFCVGEELTLLCQNDTLGYEWKYPGGMITVTSGANAKRTVNGFTATYVNTTTTTLQFVVSSDMNGITLTCTNIFGAINISATNLEVLDTSSMICPDDISAIVKDNCRYVDVSLHGVSRCTREYSATISGEADIISSVLNDTDHGAEMIPIGIFNLTNSNLELCSTYNVTVDVTFFDDSTMMCSSVAVELHVSTDSPTATSMSTMPSSSTTTTASTATGQDSINTPTHTPSPRQGSPVTVIIVVVVVVCVLMIGIIFIIIIIICCVKCKRRNSQKYLPKMHNGNLYQDVENSDHYAQVEVSNLSKSCNSQHTSQQDANDRVIYSTVQSAQQHH